MRTSLYFWSILLSAAWSQTGSITGSVLDADNEEPLIAANVTVTGRRLDTPTGSATNITGEFAVENLPPGTYVVRASYIGYDEAEERIDLGGNEQIRVIFRLKPSPIQFQGYVVTASRKRERIEDAPAAISVISELAIRRESNTNLGDYLKSVKGVEFTQSGVDSYNLSARGFNSSFSSRLLTLTDGRMANVPSLRLIAYNVIPVSFEDVKQLEVVLGPSSALYGPNAHSGVLNIITKTPQESRGTTVNLQAGMRPNQIRKATFRHASVFGDLGVKLSAVALGADEWRHFNADEYEGHDAAFLGRPHLSRDGVNNDNKSNEVGNPKFTAEMLEELMTGEIPGNGIDDNGNGFIDENLGWTGLAYADGRDNTIADGEQGAFITQEMIDAAAGDPYNRFRVPGTDIIIWGLTQSELGKRYADGKDNDGDGLIDEGIDSGIDDLTEKWYDGIDNDGDGVIDETDEQGSRWLGRFGSYSPGVGYLNNDGFGEYEYDGKGNLRFDTNRNGLFGDNWGSDGLDNDGDGEADEPGEGDFVLNYGELPRFIDDANDDGIPDWPIFDVKNYRYDLRADYEPSPDFGISLTHGYAWARNINITGLARYLADGWVYRYYQSRIHYKSWFLQTYLNTSFSGEENHPARNLATGTPVYDRSRKFSTQLQHSREFLDDRIRFVWGMDYFRTMPDTRGTILSDIAMFDGRDNNGNGEAGSPILFQDKNDNGRPDPGENYSKWASTTPFSVGGDPTDSTDVVSGAIADGIDNDGDGLIDEGIDEKAEDNRYIVNELGTYYQLNWKFSDKLEFIQATRIDVHERLSDFLDFGPDKKRNYNPLKWRLDFDKSNGLQLSPKIGLAYKPKEHQNYRLTWATAYNTPSNQALFLDIFVTRISVFKVYARGADGGYKFPRSRNGNFYWLNVNTFDYDEMDTSTHVAFYPSADPRIEGFFKKDVKDLPEIEAELVRTWEVGYKGRLLKSLYGTLDLFTSHYSSFVSPVTFITPIIVDKQVITFDYDGDGIRNTDLSNIADPEDYEEAFDHWRDHITGVAATDTIQGINPPVLVGYVNYGEVDLSGMDLSLSWFISRSWSLDLNYSFLSLTEFLNPVTGARDPINAPRHKGGMKLQYNPPDKPYSGSLGYRYVDAFPWSSGVYFGKIRTYIILDLHTNYRINDHLGAFLTVSNLLDNRHVEIIGGPALGRNVVLRLQAQL